MIEEGEFVVRATLTAWIEFSPIERERPLSVQDAIDNARGTVSEGLWAALEEEGWYIEFDAARLN